MQVKPKKSLGQHFLTDDLVVSQIIALLGSDDEHPHIEIGPGTGVLTKHVVNRFSDFYAIEIDPQAQHFLENVLPELRLVKKDILDVDFDALLKDKPRAQLFGNLPYNITSPILFLFLDNPHLFYEAVFMIQKEVAERIAAPTRTKAYGILSVQTQWLCEVEHVFNVPPQCFQPPPKVESSVIRLRHKNHKRPPHFRAMKQLVKTAFNQRRKTLRNTLKSLALPFPADFDTSRRAEELTWAQFYELTQWMDS